MPSPTASDLLDHPHCVALAPLLYVAWADGELDDGEIATVRVKAQANELTEPQRQVLERWLDPSAPPSSTELLRLYTYVKQRLGQLDAASRASLVDLGLALAKQHGDDPGEASHRALAEMEEALGLMGSEVVRELFVERPPVAQCFEEEAPSFSVEAMTGLLDGAYREDWENVRQLLRRDAFRQDVTHLDHGAYRAQVTEWLGVLAAEGLGALAFPESVGGAGRIDRFAAAFAALGMFDLSLVVKFGVQFGLFGGAILNLGTERHHEELLGEVGRGEHLGGFAMSELGHGSNVRDIETIARYEAARGVFVIHSPSASARKEWIGNAAVDGRTMVVFADLEVAGESHGVHA
ncbi:MAG: acyl-CoA dehydrogenase family protein, partial [Polyangiaceae bacterium]